MKQYYILDGVVYDYYSMELNCKYMYTYSLIISVLNKYEHKLVVL